MNIRGWIYVITNKAMPDLVKIGYSTKDPSLRARELDNSGSPHPYEVVYDALLQEPREVEQKIHALLEDVREGKEWFRCSIGDAIKAIRLASNDQEIIETGQQPSPLFFKVPLEKEVVSKRFVKDGETVLDTCTGLTWAAQDNGDDIDQSGARNYCDNYRGGGYSGWRMPTQDELAELSANRYDTLGKIHLTSPKQWASETSGSDAAGFDFNAGSRRWYPRASSCYFFRVLPVRSY